MIKELAKNILNDNIIDTESSKYLANVYGKVKKGIYWFAEYTFVINKIELIGNSGNIIKVYD